MIGGLVRSKLQKPSTNPDNLARTRLFRRLDRGLHRKLTLVSAPAGYGKSSLISSWLSTCDRPSAWLSLDKNDSDPATFLSCFISAVQTTTPDACLGTLALLSGAQLPPPDVLVTSLTNELGLLTCPSLLVLDDYHLIQDSDVHQLVAKLVEYLPAQMHLVIVTRQDPLIKIAAYRAKDQITEIRVTDLQFDRFEVQRYLEAVLEREIPQEFADALNERIEGWAVGMRLAVLAMNDRAELSGFVESFHGTHRYIRRYLLDEVLAQQSTYIRTLLLRIAILDSFSAPLCDALMALPFDAPLLDTGTPSPSTESILAGLLKTSLFVVQLDTEEQWLRYHHLFQDLLRHELVSNTDELQRTKLHRAASQWYEENGFFEEAVRHAEAAQDLEHVASLVEAQSHKLMNQERWRHLHSWLQKIPQDVMNQRPELLFSQAWVLMRSYRLGDLHQILSRVRALIDDNLETYGQERVEYLESEMSAVWCIILNEMGHAEECLEHAARAQKIVSGERGWVTSMVMITMMQSLQMLGRMDDAYRMAHTALAESSAVVDTKSIWANIGLITVEMLQSNLHAAARAARHAWSLAQPCQLLASGCWALQTLGYVHYQWNNLEEARYYFDQVLKFRYLCSGETLVQSHFGLARVLQAMERFEEADQVTASAIEWAREMDSESMLIEVQAWESRLALLQGRTPEHRHWSVPLGDTQLIMLLVEVPQLTLAQALLAEGKPSSRQRSVQLLARLRQFAQQTNNQWRLIEIATLQALVELAQGNQESAVNLVDEAVHLAQPGGFLRLFVDLGPSMAELLHMLKERGHRHQQYIDQVLAAFEPLADKTSVNLGSSNEETLVDPLTPREQDVLQLLAQRLTAKEMAEKLTISPTTVRTHIRNIYAKLEVNNRRQASERAVELRMV